MLKSKKEFKITYTTEKGFHTIKGGKGTIRAIENLYNRKILKIKEI